MPHRRLISTRAERAARLRDAAAAWLAEHDAERIAVELEAKRAEWRKPEPLAVVARRKERKARRRLTGGMKFRHHRFSTTTLLFGGSGAGPNEGRVFRVNASLWLRMFAA
jgi:hypothetical protein